LDEFAKALKITSGELLRLSGLTINIDSQQGGQNDNVTNHHLTPEAFMNELRAGLRARDEEIQFYCDNARQMMEQLREAHRQTDTLIEQVKKLVEKVIQI